MKEAAYIRLLRLVAGGDLDVLERAFAQARMRGDYAAMVNLWTHPHTLPIFSAEYRRLSGAQMPEDPRMRGWHDLRFNYGYEVRNLNPGDQVRIATGLLLRLLLLLAHMPIPVPFQSAAEITGDILYTHGLDDLDWRNFDWPVDEDETEIVHELKHILHVFYPGEAARARDWPLPGPKVGVFAGYKRWTDEDLEAGETFSDLEVELDPEEDNGQYEHMEGALNALRDLGIYLQYLDLEITPAPAVIGGAYWVDPDYIDTFEGRDWYFRITPLSREEFHPRELSFIGAHAAGAVEQWRGEA